MVGSQGLTTATFLLLLFALAAAQLGDGVGSQEAQHADVLVIGAGMAGVAAARLLVAAGHRVTVLEARNRTGGRLLSIPIIGGGRVDLGAMKIHDAGPGNELFELAQQLGLPLSHELDYRSVSTFDPSGARSHSDPGSQRRLALLFAVQLHATLSKLERAGPGADVPLSTVYGDFMKSHPGFTQHEIWSSNLFMHSSWQVLQNANITQLSTLRRRDSKVLPSADVLFRDGFDSLLGTLAAGLDIRLNTVVTAVDNSGSQGVVVSTAGGQQYRSKFAIVTVSLGVLKRGGIAFAPPLPPPKQQAVADMGMGLMDKTVLVFERAFWDDSDFITREAVDWSGRWCTFLNYQRYFGRPALVALHVADTALAMERFSDAEVVGEAMQVLRSMYGPQVPDPTQAVVTRWGADPFAYGSGAFFAAGNPRAITDVLAEPLGRLLFAGEATSAKPGTVLGAYLSGLREGRRAAGLLAGQPTGVAAAP